MVVRLITSGGQHGNQKYEMNSLWVEVDHATHEDFTCKATGMLIHPKTYFAIEAEQFQNTCMYVYLTPNTQKSLMKMKFLLKA